ncbi:MAG TPA: nitroreductase/quinone reductase family protein [Candidatus Nitrosotenuis sp.]|nr:nitroreductase/quinone reductase family protein [Candidatus Nitrosotenuis sp.]
MKDGVFKASLTTTGRKTSKEHTVTLRAVVHEGRVYFSRRNLNSDWLKNAIANPKVKVSFNDKTYTGIASLVTDQTLAKKISELKYPGEERAKDARIVLRVELRVSHTM